MHPCENCNNLAPWAFRLCDNCTEAARLIRAAIEEAKRYQPWDDGHDSLCRRAADLMGAKFTTIRAGVRREAARR